jgi:hypothetical protein
MNAAARKAEVRAVALSLPRTEEHLIRDHT